MANYFLALSYWFRSWRFIFKNNLSHYFLYPLIISVILSMGYLVIIQGAATYVMEWVSNRMDIQPIDGSPWEKTLIFLSDIATYATAIAVIWLSILVFGRLNKYFILATMSPVMARLSERTEEIITGVQHPFQFSQFIKDILRGILLSIRNFVVEFVISLLIWGITLYLTITLPFLVFIIAPFSALLLFLTGAYFFGFSVLDYWNERHQIPYKYSIRDIRSRKASVTGIGTVFSILFMIPFIGTAIGTITCTVAATMQRAEEIKRAREISESKVFETSGHHRQ